MYKPGLSKSKAADAAIVSAIGKYGVIGWFDACDLFDLSDGDTVSAWTSRVGGTALTQSTPSKRPVFSSTSFGGGACVTFDNSTQGMSALHSAGITSDSVSAIAVFYSNTTSGEASIAEYTADVNNNRGFRLILKDGKRQAELGGDSSKSYVQSSSSAAQNKTIMGMRGSRSTDPDSLDVWDQSGLLVPAASNYINSSGDHEASSLYVGNRADSGTLQLNGGLKELIILSGYVEDNDWTHLIGLVSRKHSIPAFDIQPEASDDPIDFATLSEPWGTPLAARTEGGIFCQPNGPSGYYTYNFSGRISFEAPVGKRIRFTITMAKMDSDWQYGFSFIEPIGAGGDSRIVPKVYGDSVAGTGTFASQSVPYVIETSVGQNTADFWFSSNPFSQNVRADGEWRVTVEFF
tara:strand:- start:605 stop:1819 length:1215 start_codon:yes stop_codon:yes gene_type:complete